MGPISHLTQHTAHRNDINFPPPSLLNTRNVTANRREFSRDQLICAATSQGCCDQVMKIPKAIGTFIVHRYADTRLFFRSFCSMFGSTTSSEIDRRVREIRGFNRVMQNPAVTGQAANAEFERLSSESRSLLFYADASYITQFQNERDPARAEVIRLEIVRECAQVISFQRMLTCINTFFRSFSGGEAAPSTRPHDETPSHSLWETLARLFGLMRRSGTQVRAVPATPDPVGTPGGAVPNVDLNIPNTVPYVQDGIAAQIQAKAEEIIQLRSRFTSAIPAEYKHYECPASADFMAIPVFDASHPAVQAGLPNLRTALAVGSGAAVLQDHRNVRHTIDKDSLEGQIAAGTSYAPAKCMLCRHPEHGGIRRGVLRIDTALQDEILQYLRSAVPATS